MRLFQRVVDLILPDRCVGCQAPGGAWCSACARSLAGAGPFPVARPALRSAYAVSAYTGPARRAVLAYKEGNRRDLASWFGQALAAALPTVLSTVLGPAARAGPATPALVSPRASPTVLGPAAGAGLVAPALVSPRGLPTVLGPAAGAGPAAPRSPALESPPARPTVLGPAASALESPPTLPRPGPTSDDPRQRPALALVPAPSRPAAASRRGGDHMLAVAGWCARYLRRAGAEVAVVPALRLSGRAVDSVGLPAAARAANLAGRLRPVPGRAPPPHATVVLLDDVITTGATAAACVTALASVAVPVTVVLALTAAV